MPGYQACCAHDHDCEAAECGPSWSLHEKIDMPQVWALNEAQEGSARKVFRAWAERLQPPAQPLDSHEDDPELLIHIPFNGNVKVKAICVIGDTGGRAPAELRAFVNRDDLDFATVADLPPAQCWDLQDDASGTVEYPTQVTKFSGIHSLDLHIPSNFGAPSTRITFIGLKGEFTEAKRAAVVAVYEARPVPGDHPVPSAEMGSSHLPDVS